MFNIVTCRNILHSPIHSECKENLHNSAITYTNMNAKFVNKSQ